MSKIEKQLKIKILLSAFLDSIREYELEANKSIAEDDRESLEFVQIFLESDKGFKPFLSLLNNE